MGKLNLKTTLALLVVGSAITPLLLVGFYAFDKASTALESAAFEKMEGIKAAKTDAIVKYYNQVRDQAITFSENKMVVNAMRDLSELAENYRIELDIQPNKLTEMKQSLNNFYNREFAKKYKEENGKDIDVSQLFSKLDDDAIALQYAYLANNPKPLGSKDLLDIADEPSSYSLIHAQNHPVIRNYLKKFGYYDIFLVEPQNGRIIYSVFKEIDFATSLIKGPYKNSNLATAYKLARKSTTPNDSFLVDYQSYTPSYAAPASFISSPIFEESQLVGVLIFQIPVTKINAIMAERSGMGETGETYIVGQDNLLRSNTHLGGDEYSIANSYANPDKIKIATDSVKFALAKKNGTNRTTNYLGHDVLSSFAPLEILGLNWAFVAEIGTSEAFAAVNELRNAMGLTILLSAIVLLAIAIMFSSKLSNKIRNTAIDLRTGANHISNSATDISNGSKKLSESSSTQASSLHETVTAVDEISAMVKRNADSAQRSTQVSTKSTQGAKQGKEKISQMISAIGEISKANDSILHQMKSSNREISGIANVIGEIGEKTKVINEIVFQTKLLSFNASVEAARAGEHGKGFAVVAEEVGNLATMSGSAAKEISDMLEVSIKKVQQIVDDTNRKVEILVKQGIEKMELGKNTANECGAALDEILDDVSNVNQMVKEIASASVEQSQGIEEVTNAMSQLDRITQANASLAKDSASHSESLESQATQLNDLVKRLMEIVDSKSDESNKHTSAQDLDEEHLPPKNNKKFGLRLAKIIPFKRNPKAETSSEDQFESNQKRSA